MILSNVKIFNTFLFKLLKYYSDASFIMVASKSFSLFTGKTFPFLSTINLPAKFHATSPRTPILHNNLLDKDLM